MEKYLTTLETSKRLKAHKVDQGKSSFYWKLNPETQQHVVVYSNFEDAGTDSIAAFTASEIAAFLKGFGDWVTYVQDGMVIRFMARDGGILDAKDFGENEGEGRGLILVGMLDAKIIKLKGKLELL